MVRKERLELSRLATLEPKSSASTNSATLAKEGDYTLHFCSCITSKEQMIYREQQITSLV